MLFLQSWPLLPKSFASVNNNTSNGETQHSEPISTKSNDTFIIEDPFEERGKLNRQNYT